MILKDIAEFLIFDYVSALDNKKICLKLNQGVIKYKVLFQTVADI